MILTRKANGLVNETESFLVNPGPEPSEAAVVEASDDLNEEQRWLGLRPFVCGCLSVRRVAVRGRPNLPSWRLRMILTRQRYGLVDETGSFLANPGPEASEPAVVKASDDFNKEKLRFGQRNRELSGES